MKFMKHNGLQMKRQPKIVVYIISKTMYSGYIMMKGTNMTPRLGSAQIIVSINDTDGLVVYHGGEPDLILASLPASECDGTTWNKIWETLDGLGVIRNQI